MTNNDKVKTIFSLVGELLADSLLPDADTRVPATVSAEPNEESAESDPDMWLTFSPDLQWRAAKLGQC